MLELLLLAGAGSIAYSVFQGIRRGDVSIEERKANPTLIEKVAKSVDELDERVTLATARTTFVREHCAWFKHFSAWVSASLEHAKSMAEFDERLSADPEYKRLYDQTAKRFEDLRERYSKPLTEPEWAKNDAPPPPRSAADPRLQAIHESVYQEHFRQHQEFVDDVRRQLRQQPLLKKFFNDAMAERGLAKLVAEHFPDSDTKDEGLGTQGSLL